MSESSKRRSLRCALTANPRYSGIVRDLYFKRISTTLHETYARLIWALDWNGKLAYNLAHDRDRKRHMLFRRAASGRHRGRIGASLCDSGRRELHHTAA